MSERSPSRLRLALRRLADPKVIGWPMFWISYALFTLDRLPVFGGSLNLVSPSEIPAIAWSVTVSQIVTFTVLLLARVSYLSSVPARRHPSWTVLSFLVAAYIGDVIGTWAAAWSEPLLGTAQSSDALGSAWVKALALCAIGIIVAAFREHRAQVTDLVTAQVRLQSTRQEAERAIERERAQVVDDLTFSLTSTLESLSTADPSRAVSTLRAAAADVVRPLSHELAAQESDFAPASPPTIRPAPRRSVLAEVPAAPLIAPAVMATVVTLLASRLTVRAGVMNPAQSAAATTIGPLTLSVDLRPLTEALLALTAVFVATWLAATVARRLSLPLLERASIARRWAVTVAGVLLIGVMSQALIGLAFLLPGFPALPELSPTVHLVLVLPLLLIALVVGTSRAVAIRQQGLRIELERANDELAWEVARTNEALWQQRRQLAHLVHGPLQAALNAGAIAIDANEDTGELASTTLERVRTDVRTALERLTAPFEPEVEPSEVIAQAQRLWSDVCQIEVFIPEPIYQQLAQDPVTASTATEIVNEACANAIIHGNATRIEVTAEIADARCLVITVADNGESEVAQDAERPGGLGTQFLNDVCLDWTRRSGSSGTTLCVRLPARLSD